MVSLVPTITIGPDAATYTLRNDVDLERLRTSFLTSRLVRVPTITDDGNTVELWVNAGAAPWWTISE